MIWFPKKTKPVHKLDNRICVELSALVIAVRRDRLRVQVPALKIYNSDQTGATIDLLVDHSARNVGDTVAITLAVDTAYCSIQDHS